MPIKRNSQDTMPFEEMNFQNHEWSTHHNPLEVTNQTRIWLLVVFFVVSFICIGYVFWIAADKDRKEQKNK